MPGLARDPERIRLDEGEGPDTLGILEGERERDEPAMGPAGEVEAL